MCDFQVSIGYKRPISYHLTPSRKKVGKSLARGSKCAVIRECFKDETLCKFIIHKVGSMVHHEIASLCSDRVNSMLLHPHPDKLNSFSWEELYSEFNDYCPLLTEVMKCGTKTRLPKTSQNAIICLCMSIMCNHRCKSMSLVQQVISTLLYIQVTIQRK